MKLSTAWLKNEFKLTVASAELSQRLTMAGLEVDGILPATPAFSGVVVGEVVALTAHENADKLKIATVNIGTDEPLQIVCGAANVAQGIRVPVALIGAVLPDNIHIKKSKLRGVASFGMLCSARELGMSDDHSGLMILPQDAPIGTDLRHYLQLDDPILEIDLTPNRADCFSMRGLAREVALLLQKPLTFTPVPEYPATADARFHIDNRAPKDCPLYLARRIEGINNHQETPFWLRERLRRAGIRTHDPIVDCTNYVMMLLGTPLHAFDAAKVAGDIVIRRAQKAESLVLLNDHQAALDEDVLLIADQEKALAIAGVMGGKETACTENTQAVILESAWFQPVTISGKARRFALSSDSAQRFERGVDFTLQRQALDLVTQLIIEICGGSASAIVEHHAPEFLPQRLPITLPFTEIPRLLGYSYPDENIKNIFVSLGCTIEKTTDSWLITPPAWRFDLAIAADCIEEIARVEGYDHISEQLPAQVYQKDHQAPPSDAVLRCEMVAMGFQETITLSFIDRATHAAFFADAPTVNLFNPISAELSEMRLSLVPSLVQKLIYNRHRQQNDVRLFEIGSVFIPQGNSAADCQQIEHIAGVMSGHAQPEQWGFNSRTVDFFDVKGVVERLVAGLDVSYQRSNVAYLHPHQSAEIIYRDQSIGRFGMLHPSMLETLNTKGGAIAVFEITIAPLLFHHTPQFQTIAKFPSVRRDIALVLDRSIDAESVLNLLKKHGGNVLKQCFCFDVFTGTPLTDDKKSMAVALILQDNEKTLQDEDVERIIAPLIELLHQNFGAELR